MEVFPGPAGEVGCESADITETKRENGYRNQLEDEKRGGEKA